MWVTDETKGDRRTDRRKDGTYSAGVKDSASAYVLCPRLTERFVSFYLGGGRKHGEGLRRISREMRAGKECGRRNDGILTKLVYKLKLTTRACRNLYILEQ